VVGRLLSLALWPISKVFEYRISGTLAEPKITPVYFVPKIMRLPVDILREMRERPVSTDTFADPPSGSP
jgi:hypothetical protein